MLVLSRKTQQEVIIGENVRITVLQIKGNTVRLGIEAPRDIRVVRGELPAVDDEAGVPEMTLQDEAVVREFTLDFDLESGSSNETGIGKSETVRETPTVGYEVVSKVLPADRMRTVSVHKPANRGSRSESGFRVVGTDGAVEHLSGIDSESVNESNEEGEKRVKNHNRVLEILASLTKK
ncbi:MAG: carbon storage regulator [Pirellulaceae bacterium]